MTEPRRFALPPTGLFARLMPAVVGVLMPLAFAGMLALQSPPAAPPWPLVIATLLLMPLTGLAIAAQLHGRVVEVAGGILQVRRWPLPRRFSIALLDLAAARVSDLTVDRDLQPMLRLMGTRMPGMRSGWFLTRARRRAYVLATTSPEVAVLPLHDGRLLLLGVERPQALLDALRDDGRARR